MNVNLKRSCFVEPAEPTWNGSLPLSELDQIGSLNYVSLIHLYRPPQKWSTPPDAIFQTIKRSLGKVLVPFHPLAGRLSRIAGGRLEIDCNAMGVRLIEAESEATLEELKQSEHHQLVPSIDVSSTTPELQLPLLAVQVTRFKCGSVCLGVAMSHAAVDGQSASHFYAEWARLARLEPLETEPFLDRKLFGGMPSESVPQQPAEFDPPPSLIVSDNHIEAEKPSMSIARATLRLTKIELEMLKRKARESHGHEQYPFTRYEAITAYIWRCACKARQLRAEQQTRLGISVDVRQRMQPPLPPKYFGNAVLDVVTMSISDDIVSKPLYCTCSLIREAINKVTNEYVNTSINFLKRVDDLSSFQDWSSTITTEKDKELCSCGNPNLCVTSWLTLGFQGIDFGWEKEIYMGPVDYGTDGDFLIIPCGHDNDGSVDVVVCLQEAHMEAFKELFCLEKIAIHESSTTHHSGESSMGCVDSSLATRTFSDMKELLSCD